MYDYHIDNKYADVRRNGNRLLVGMSEKLRHI
jgi:hypothetical protein